MEDPFPRSGHLTKCSSNLSQGHFDQNVLNFGDVTSSVLFLLNTAHDPVFRGNFSSYSHLVNCMHVEKERELACVCF